MTTIETRTVTIPLNVAASMEAILAYNWPDESRDYDRERQPVGHVFDHMLTVDAWLDEAGLSTAN